MSKLPEKIEQAIEVVEHEWERLGKSERMATVRASHHATNELRTAILEEMKNQREIGYEEGQDSCSEFAYAK